MTRQPFVLNLCVDFVFLEERKNPIKTSSGQTDVQGEILSTADNARLIPYRQTHGLGLVKLRALKSGQADQTIRQRLGEIFLGDKDLIGQHQRQ